MASQSAKTKIVSQIEAAGEKLLTQMLLHYTTLSSFQTPLRPTVTIVASTNTCDTIIQPTDPARMLAYTAAAQIAATLIISPLMVLHEFSIILRTMDV